MIGSVVDDWRFMIHFSEDYSKSIGALNSSIERCLTVTNINRGNERGHTQLRGYPGTYPETGPVEYLILLLISIFPGLECLLSDKDVFCN